MREVKLYHLSRCTWQSHLLLNISLYIRRISLWKFLAPFLLSYLKKERHKQLCLHFSLVRISMLRGVGAGQLLCSCHIETLGDPCSSNHPMLLSPKLTPAVLGNTFPAWNGCIRVWTEQWDQHSQPGLGKGWSGAGHRSCPSVGVHLTLNVAGGKAISTKPHGKENKHVKL